MSEATLKSSTKSTFAKSTTVESFIKKVSGLYEVEYGDFKRKVGQYVLRLQDELSTEQKTPEVLKIIEEIKMITVYVPSGDIEETRERVLELALALSRHLA